MSLKKDHILIVSNKEERIQELKDIIAGDYDIICCTNGKEAFDYMNQNPLEIDLVISNMNMDAVNGFDLVHLMKISKVLNLIPVVMINEIEVDEDVIRAYQSGVADVLKYPFIKEMVMTRVKTVIKAYKNDLMALTLNKVVPKYVNTEKERLISSTETMSYEYQAEMIGYVAECAEIIKKHPRHSGMYVKA